MFASALMFLGLASICQYVMPSTENVGYKHLMVKPEDSIFDVYLKNATSGLFFCGGTLIGDASILTAAECVKHRRKEDININVYSRSNTSQILSHVIARPIREIIIHEEYDLRDPWRNDIAILKLKTHIEVYVNYLIRVSHVPNIEEGRQLAQKLLEKKLSAAISGRGITLGQTQSPHQVLKSNTSIHDWSLCKMLFNQTLHYIISESHICVDNPVWNLTFETRISVVGSPLIVNSTVVGIASSSSWDKQYPLLFTNVSSYWNWIQSNGPSLRQSKTKPNTFSKLISDNFDK